MNVLPLIAASIDTHPMYAAVPAVDTGDRPGAVVISWLPDPVIPAGTEHLYRWAIDAEVTDPHVTLDANALAYLLFVGNADFDEDLDDTAAMKAVTQALAQVHCDMDRAVEEATTEIYSHPDVAGPRWNRCVTRGARMAGIEA